MSTLQSLHSFLSDLFYADCWLHWKFRHCRKVTPRRQGGKASPDMPVSVFFPKHALINQMWSNTSTEHVVPLSVSKGRSLSSSVMNQSREFWATLLGAPLTGTLSESFVFGQFNCWISWSPYISLQVFLFEVQPTAGLPPLSKKKTYHWQWDFPHYLYLTNVLMLKKHLLKITWSKMTHIIQLLYTILINSQFSITII